MAQVKKPPIGIDLGTTYSCVAVYEHGKVEVIANDQGNRITPSCVAFTDEERLIGESAVNQIGMNPTNTVFDVKRMIGAPFGKKSLENDMKRWPFTLINVDKKPKIQVEFKGKTKTFYPEEISAMVLMKMKETAETYLGKPVTDAVITVPAYFNDAQRNATKYAGSIAGLNVLRLINEPTAAAIAYGLDRKINARTLLVFDLGGGTFDVSILQINDGRYRVKAVSGDTHLGGQDFDNRLVDHFVEEFKTKYKKDLTTSKRAMERLRIKCERAKRSLSANARARIEIEALFEGIDYSTTLTKARFEDLVADLFDQLLGPVEEALKDANMEKNQIDEVILAGGSTRMPKIQEILKEFFEEKELNKNINPDEAVGYGAAVMASAISGNLAGQTLVFEDVIPLSLGVKVKGQLMSTIIERNTPIPVKKTRKGYTTVRDNQTEILFEVYEGERAPTNENRFLNDFEIRGIPPAPARVPKIDVTVEVDENGIRTVSAVDKASDSTSMIVIDHDLGHFTKEQTDQLIKEAEKYQKEDEQYRMNVHAQNALEEYIYKVKSAAQHQKVQGTVSNDEIKATLDKCEQVLQWLELNKSAKPDAVQLQTKDLEKMWNPIISRVYHKVPEREIEEID